MKRDFLKELGLEDEAIDKVMGEYGKTVGNLQTNITTLETEKATYQEQLEQRNKDLEKLKGSTEFNEEQLKEFQTLQTKYNEEKENWENTLKATEKKNAFDVLIAGAGVIDPLALKVHLQPFVDEAEFKDGELVGVQEKMNELLGDKLAYLKPTENKALGKPINNPPKNDEREEAIFKGFGLK